MSDATYWRSMWRQAVDQLMRQVDEVAGYEETLHLAAGRIADLETAVDLLNSEAEALREDLEAARSVPLTSRCREQFNRDYAQMAGWTVVDTTAPSGDGEPPRIRGWGSGDEGRKP